MRRYSFLLIIMLTGFSCSNGETDVTNSLTDTVKIHIQGNSLEGSDDMRALCQQFTLTKKQVADYYRTSRSVTEREAHADHPILPCYSTGTIVIDQEEFSWIIRAGGVGNFVGKTKQSVRVCDEECCTQIRTIC